MSKHDEFILAPITRIIHEAIVASRGISIGIETYPINEYLMQSILLKMTGFQEQKMKCLLWEMASNDFDYRRTLLMNEDRLGECSTYKAKNTIYGRLIEAIESLDNSGNISEPPNKENLLQSTITDIKTLFYDTNLSIWSQRHYDYFSKNRFTDENQFLDGKNLFKDVPQPSQAPKPLSNSPNHTSEKKQEYERKLAKYNRNIKNNLITKYNALYKQRNRIAHNTQSYQINLPSLKTLQKENEESRNYFVWFAVLTLIDKIFIELYTIYKGCLEDSVD